MGVNKAMGLISAHYFLDLFYSDSVLTPEYDRSRIRGRVRGSILVQRFSTTRADVERSDR
jgi:hypothetical protein